MSSDVLLNICQVNLQDSATGTGRAVFRLNKALNEYGVSSKLYVGEKLTACPNVIGPSSRWEQLEHRLRGYISSKVSKRFNEASGILHSISILDSKWPGFLNQIEAEVVHLHWVQNEMISIRDIGRIKKPIVWTLHDMWAFCGAEHVAFDRSQWKSDYRVDNSSILPDISQWTWDRKKRYWHRPFDIIAPSKWMHDCASKSSLFEGWPIHIIPNCIDTDFWRPIKKEEAKRALGYSEEVPLIIFGAYGGGKENYKGLDLLIEAASFLSTSYPDRTCSFAAFGGSSDICIPGVDGVVRSLGSFRDDLSLRIIYSAADVIVIPSRVDNFPNVALEASACGAPICCFNVGGLPDIVAHQETGFVAPAFEANALAQGILWCVDSNMELRLSRQARERCKALFSPSRICGLHKDVYKQVLERNNTCIN